MISSESDGVGASSPPRQTPHKAQAREAQQRHRPSRDFRRDGDRYGAKVGVLACLGRNAVEAKHIFRTASIGGQPPPCRGEILDQLRRLDALRRARARRDIIRHLDVDAGRLRRIPPLVLANDIT